MFKHKGWFRDLACFCSFLVLFSSLLQSGYGQQGIRDLPNAPLKVQPKPPKRPVEKLLEAVAPHLPPANTASPDFSPAGLRIKPPKSPPTHFDGKPAAIIRHPQAPLQLAGPDDPSDSYIVTQANALNKNPQQIFAFVRDQIGYEA